MSASCPELGFTVRFSVTADVSPSAMRRLAVELVELLEADGLTASGTANASFVVRRHGTQATEMDRQLVQGWAERRTDVAEVQVSDLVDLSTAS